MALLVVRQTDLSLLEPQRQLQLSRERVTAGGHDQLWKAAFRAFNEEPAMSMQEG